MAILLTESAAERVRSHLLKRGAGVGLRGWHQEKPAVPDFAYVVNYATRSVPRTPCSKPAA